MTPNTATVLPFEAPQPHAPMLTQHLLTRGRRAQLKVETRRAQLKAADAELDSISKEVLSLADGGVPEEPGARTYEVKRRAGRRSVPWRRVVVQLKSEAYAKRITCNTKPGPATRTVRFA